MISDETDSDAVDNNVLTKMMGLKECEIRRFGFTFFGCVPGRVFVREVQFPSVYAQEGGESG